MRLDYLASFLEASYEGDPAYEIDGIAAIEKANTNQLTFVASEKYWKYLASTKAGVVVLTEKAASEYSGNKIIVTNPYFAYAKLTSVFNSRTRQVQGIHPSACVAETASIAASASIGAYCVIAAGAIIGENSEIYPGCFIGENSRIGDNALIHSNVSIYTDVQIGNNVVIHSGTVIGSDGFGFAPTQGAWLKIHQLGGVTIGNNVEIGSNTTIDCGALEDTVIEDNVIIDNQVHIAHNVKIGSGTAIAGCVGIAGSVVVGKNCTFAGKVGVSGHINIADNTHFLGGTVVTKGNKEGGHFASASPLMELKQWRKTSVRYRQLEEWVERIKALEQSGKNE